jgi:ferredoxin
MPEDSYLQIAELIDMNPQRAPRVEDGFSPAFIEHLELLFSPEEAELVRHLGAPTANPGKFVTAETVAGEAGIAVEEARRVLEGALARGVIAGFGGSYSLPPLPLILNAGQFSADVTPEDIRSAELYQKYFIDEGFYRYYESSEKGTQVMRVIPVMRAIEHEEKVLDVEEAHRILEAIEPLALVPCPCRTRTEKLGIRECAGKYPVGACIMGGTSAFYFQNLGLGKTVTTEQAKKYFDEMQDLGLVGTTENYADPRHTVICLCCDCCCSQLRGRTRWENPDAVSASNFVPVAGDDCAMCGVCVDRCFFGAIQIDEEVGRAVVNQEKCIGCGVCTLTCDTDALRLRRLERAEILERPGDLYKRIAHENRGVD